MIPRNAVTFDLHSEQGRDELSKADLELMVGRILDHAAMHVSADEIKEIGKGFVADEKSTCSSKQINNEG